MNMEEYFRQNKSKISIIVFLAFLLMGVFLRTYNFHDWLRFNADQSRDASVVDNYLQGESDLPNLGPKAGGTFFKLGPIFYYFQITSAKIFGAAPDKIAYPDLLFSILAIPLLYLLMRRYFSRQFSAALAALMSVSMFCVQYSRFAWNPNSAPFFTLLFLYSLLRLADPGKNKKYFWAALAGISLGIAMQLHTVLLILMPITLLVFLEYVYKTTGKTLTKEFAVVFLLALMMNFPQITGEIQSGGQNIKDFFSGAVKKTSNEIGVGKKITENLLCQAQGTGYILSAIGPSGDCGKTVITGELKRHKHFDKKIPIILETLFGLIFTIGGIFIWAKFVRKEKDAGKRRFLVLLGIYFVAGFFLLVSFANEISIRFYLTLIFVPFLLLGLWMENLLIWTKEKNKKYMIAVILLVLAVLFGSNIYKTGKMFAAFSSQDEAEDDGVDNDSESFITLSEAEFLAKYIVAHAEGKRTVYLDGRQKYLFKYARSIKYLTRKQGIDVKEYSGKENLPEDASIMLMGNSKNIGKPDGTLQEKYFANNVQSFGRFSIAMLEKNPQNK